MKMMPYSRGIILDNTNNYGIVKTETVFGFGSSRREPFVNTSFKTSEPLEWIFSHGNIKRRSLQDADLSRSLKKISKRTTSPPEIRSKKNKKELVKKNGKKRKGKAKKCILKVIKAWKKKKGKRRHRKVHKKKYMLPLILGLLAAKAFLIPIALKALAFISAKGLIMGFFSTMLASVLSLKGMFDHSHAWNRKDDTKTQVEIFQVPPKNEDHIYYDDIHYRRGDSDYTNIPSRRVR